MAVIFMDGFDYYATADIEKRWTTNGSGVIGATYARSPMGQGLYLGNGTNVVKSFSSNYTGSCIFGFAYKAGVDTATETLFAVYDGATEQCSVRTNSSGVLVVTQNGTARATGTTVLSVGIWYYIEFKVTVHGSTGIAEVRLNGSTEIASTGSLDLTGTANNYFNAIRLVGTGGTASYDDFYFLDTTTGSNTTWLGAVNIVVRRVTGAGTTTQWTPNGGTNSGCVSEPFQDGDGSFNMSNTANQIDTFAMEDLPIASGSVYAVQPVLTVRQDSGAARTIAPVLRVNGTDYVGTTVSLSTSYQMLNQVYDVSPDSSSAWSVSELNGLEAGYKLIS